MTNRIGPKQRRILQAINNGGELYQAKGWWYFSAADCPAQFQSRRRCFALYIRGFLMAESVNGFFTRYVLTEKGKAVI